MLWHNTRIEPVFPSTCTFLHQCVSVRVCVCVCLSIYPCLCVCVCLYVYLYTHVCIHFIYIYTCKTHVYTRYMYAHTICTCARCFTASLSLLYRRGVVCVWRGQGGYQCQRDFIYQQLASGRRWGGGACTTARARWVAKPDEDSGANM